MPEGVKGILSRWSRVSARKRIWREGEVTSSWLWPWSCWPFSVWRPPCWSSPIHIHNDCMPWLHPFKKEHSHQRDNLPTFYRLQDRGHFNRISTAGPAHVCASRRGCVVGTLRALRIRSVRTTSRSILSGEAVANVDLASFDRWACHSCRGLLLIKGVSAWDLPRPGSGPGAGRD